MRADRIVISLLHHHHTIASTARLLSISRRARSRRPVSQLTNCLQTACSKSRLNSQPARRSPAPTFSFCHHFPSDAPNQTPAPNYKHHHSPTLCSPAPRHPLTPLPSKHHPKNVFRACVSLPHSLNHPSIAAPPSHHRHVTALRPRENFPCPATLSQMKELALSRTKAILSRTQCFRQQSHSPGMVGYSTIKTSLQNSSGYDNTTPSQPSPTPNTTTTWQASS